MMPTVSTILAENRTILQPISWTTFNNLLTELGNQRNTRLTYHQAVLEIMTPLGEHENNNRFIDDIVRILAEELNLPLKKMGSLTLKKDNLQQAVEPDSCYYLTQEPLVRNKQNIDLNIDPPPDLVLEIDITNTSLNKLPIYASLQVPEIWRYNGRSLQVFVLDLDKREYNQVIISPTFPQLNIESIPQLISQSLIVGETATLKTFRNTLREII
jgi:Uma2 family endonuclease